MQPVKEELPILTVTQLTNAIKHCLEKTFPMISLQGEISNFKKQSSGHLYFSLKDSNSQISAVMFRGNATSLKMLPKDGDQVIVRGEINVYPPSGRYQVVVRELKLAGLGELLMKLEELKIKLNKKGYFRKEYKKPLPPFPKTIGVVTSPTGAAIQDMLNILTRRYGGFHLILNPVKVQGEGAAEEIAQAINQFNELNLVDVMIVGRGGGSIEDLWAFNEEIVAEAIFKSSIPIVGAVGHETDHCIAEYVADVRAPTPSAAAEIVMGERTHHMEKLHQTAHRLHQTLRHWIQQYRSQLQGFLHHPIFSTPYTLLGPYMQRIDDLRHRIDQNMLQIITKMKLLIEARHKEVEALKPTTQIRQYRQQLVQFNLALNNSMTHRIKQTHQKILSAKELLYAIDPKNLLSKGYAILFSENKESVITSTKDVNINQNVRVMLSDGEFVSTIKEIISSERREKSKKR